MEMVKGFLDFLANDICTYQDDVSDDSISSTDQDEKNVFHHARVRSQSIIQKVAFWGFNVQELDKFQQLASDNESCAANDSDMQFYRTSGQKSHRSIHRANFHCNTSSDLFFKDLERMKKANPAPFEYQKRREEYSKLLAKQKRYFQIFKTKFFNSWYANFGFYIDKGEYWNNEDLWRSASKFSKCEVYQNISLKFYVGFGIIIFRIFGWVGNHSRW